MEKWVLGARFALATTKNGREKLLQMFTFQCCVNPALPFKLVPPLASRRLLAGETYDGGQSKIRPTNRPVFLFVTLPFNPTNGNFTSQLPSSLLSCPQSTPILHRHDGKDQHEEYMRPQSPWACSSPPFYPTMSLVIGS